MDTVETDAEITIWREQNRYSQNALKCERLGGISNKASFTRSCLKFRVLSDVVSAN